MGRPQIRERCSPMRRTTSLHRGNDNPSLGHAGEQCVGLADHIPLRDDLGGDFGGHWSTRKEKPVLPVPAVHVTQPCAGFLHLVDGTLERESGMRIDIGLRRRDRTHYSVQFLGNCPQLLCGKNRTRKGAPAETSAPFYLPASRSIFSSSTIGTLNVRPILMVGSCPRL